MIVFDFRNRRVYRTDGVVVPRDIPVRVKVDLAKYARSMARVSPTSDELQALGERMSLGITQGITQATARMFPERRRTHPLWRFTPSR